MYPGFEIIFYLFLIVGVIQLLLGLESFRGGLGFLAYINTRLGRRSEAFPGLVTVIVPCRGIDEGFEQNIDAVLKQDRDDYEVIFVVDSEADESFPVIQKLIEGRTDSKIIVAGPAKDAGQKVHNLIVAAESAHLESKAFVFMDSDACPSGEWLGNLLGPLSDPENGCSSGYRWFIGKQGGFATHLRSAWNASIASSLGPNKSSNFCWGGSTAIRRPVFEELKVSQKWKGTVSDDFVLTNALKDAGYAIHFEPKCLTVTIGDTTFSEMFEFTTRQMKITKTYSRSHFVVSLVGAVLFVLSILLSFGVIAASADSRLFIAVGFLLLVWILGSAKAVIRIYAVGKCLPGYTAKIRAQYFSHILLWPVSAFLFLVNDIFAIVSNRICWRGISYELVSDKEMRILD